MTATQTIDALYALGAELTARGDALHIIPGTVLNDVLRAAIRAHKPEIIAHLTGTRSVLFRDLYDPIAAREHAAAASNMPAEQRQALFDYADAFERQNSA